MAHRFTVERTKTRKKRARPEQDFQRELVRAFGYLLTPATFWFAVPNGGWRSSVEAAIFKGQGVKAGVPDIILIHAGRALGLELKSQIGRLSPEQRDVHDQMRGAGSRVEIARNISQALDHLRSFGIPLRDLPAKFVFGSAV